MDLGEKIRRLRTKKGMTQSQLAGVQITRNMLSQIENGLASPSMKTLAYLAQMLDVSVAYLIGEKEHDSLATAKKFVKKGEYAMAVQTVEEAGQDGDEAEAILAMAYGEMAWSAFLNGDNQRATEFAKNALDHNESTFFSSRELTMQMLWLTASCGVGSNAGEKAMEFYRAAYQDWGWEARHHLLGARYYLQQDQMQAAEREIWTITALSESERPQYLLLRGWLALRQEKYSTAVSYLKQLEDMHLGSVRLQKELYTLLEHAYKEMDDYKAAYEYASKLREI